MDSESIKQPSEEDCASNGSMAYPFIAKGEGLIADAIRKIAFDDYFNSIWHFFH